MAEPGYDHSRWPTLKAPEVWESQGLRTGTASSGTAARSRSRPHKPAPPRSAPATSTTVTTATSMASASAVSPARSRSSAPGAGWPPEGSAATSSPSASRTMAVAAASWRPGPDATRRNHGRPCGAVRHPPRAVQAKLATQPSANDAPTPPSMPWSSCAGLPVAGVIWYQGESNVGRAERYREDSPTLIREWRAHLRSPRCPSWRQLAAFLPMADNNVNDAPWPSCVMPRPPRSACPTPAWPSPPTSATPTTSTCATSAPWASDLARWLTDPANATGPRFCQGHAQGQGVGARLRPPRPAGAWRQPQRLCLAQGDGPSSPPRRA